MELALRLFDAELAAERLASAGAKAATAAGELPAPARAALIEALGLLQFGLRGDGGTKALGGAERIAEDLLNQRPSSGDGEEPAGVTEAHRLALTIIGMAAATTEMRSLVDQVMARPLVAPPAAEQPPGDDAATADTDPDADPDHSERPGSRAARLRPTTRQAIQVAIAASLAIIAGELLSPARWYWAVIAAFVIFSGTTSRGDILTKGGQRLLGTALGVPAGVLIATAVGGNTAWSLVLIFVCLFAGFYLVKVSYLMMFWITTMLALLYGLLGQFSVGVLVLRIEETAIGAVIGVGVAVLVLPTSTRTTIGDAARTFLDTLAELIEAATQNLLGERTPQNLTEQARALGQDLQQLRTSAKPLTKGLSGISGRGTTRRGLRVLTACDHYARTLVRSSDRPGLARTTPVLAATVKSAAARTTGNVMALTELLGHHGHATVHPAADLLAAAIEGHRGAARSPDPDIRRLHTALYALRDIDQAVVDLAYEHGATPRGAAEATPVSTHT